MYGWCIAFFLEASGGGWWLDWIGLILGGFCSGDGAVKGFD